MNEYIPNFNGFLGTTESYDVNGAASTKASKPFLKSDSIT
jgi:hypothetical protein